MCGFWLLALFDDHWPTNSNVRMNCYSFNRIYCISPYSTILFQSIVEFVCPSMSLYHQSVSVSMSLRLCVSVSLCLSICISVCLSCSLYWFKSTDELYSDHWWLTLSRSGSRSEVVDPIIIPIITVLHRQLRNCKGDWGRGEDNNTHTNHK